MQNQLTERGEGLPLVAGHAGEGGQVARCRRGDAGGVVPERGTHILNTGGLSMAMGLRDISQCYEKEV